MPRKKKIKTKKEKKGLSKLTNFTTKSLSGAFLNFKKNQELKKIKEIKLKRIQENNSLVKERQLIRSTRELYDGEQKALNVLKPLVFAGLIIEGGGVSYDSNMISGGEGARVFGIGSSKQYRTDQVTIAMRIIAVQTGEVLMTISATKTIASHQAGADVFRFFDLRTKALEIETGAAVNEPTDYAIRSAIEYGVLKMVERGERLGFWKFKKWRVEE